LSNAQIARAESLQRPQGLVVTLLLTDEGRDQLRELTSAHIGDHLAVLINSTVVSEPAIIVDTLGRTRAMPSQVTINLPEEQARQLTRALSQTWPAGGER
jgi:preprotein translocase subunit SecD